MMRSISAGWLIRATPPIARMSAGMRSSAITATAPASSATFACSGVTTSMMTPPLSICASPRLTVSVPVACPFISASLSCSNIPRSMRTIETFRSVAPQPEAGGGSAAAEPGGRVGRRAVRRRAGGGASVDTSFGSWRRAAAAAGARCRCRGSAGSSAPGSASRGAAAGCRPAACGVGGRVTRGSGNAGSVATETTCRRFQFFSSPRADGSASGTGVTAGPDDRDAALRLQQNPVAELLADQDRDDEHDGARDQERGEPRAAAWRHGRRIRQTGAAASRGWPWVGIASTSTGSPILTSSIRPASTRWRSISPRKCSVTSRARSRSLHEVDQDGAVLVLERDRADLDGRGADLVGHVAPGEVHLVRLVGRGEVHVADDDLALGVDHVAVAAPAPVHAHRGRPRPVRRQQRRDVRPAARAVAVQAAHGLRDRPQVFRAGPRREVHPAVGQRAAVEPLAELAGHGVARRAGFHRLVDHLEPVRRFMRRAVARERDREPQA